tara:strand:+ start:93 stop:770 length:678 start_codon:yes stop_codon:yes gene_type:complete
MAKSSKDIPKGSSPLRNLRGQLIGYQTPSGKKVYFETSQGEAPIKPIAAGSGRLVPGTSQENPTTKPSATDKLVRQDIKRYGDTVPAGSFGITKQQIKINQKDPDTPSEPQVDATPDEPLEAEPVPASEVTKPPSQRELQIKEARVKYKDSPFKQWAHANQKLAKALKPGQVGYAQVQEYFKEQKGKLKVKPEEKPFIKSNASQLQMGPGANDLRGYAGSTSPIA